MAKTGINGRLHWCSNLVPLLPTQNIHYELIYVAEMLFSVCFCPFLATVGPNLGHSGSVKWAKLIQLDVLCAVSTFLNLFHKIGVQHMAIILKIPILGIFLRLWAL